MADKKRAGSGENESQRRCSSCGCRLSRYNSDAVCAACARTRRSDVSATVSVPEYVWQDPAVREALAVRDFGELLRQVRRQADLRQEDLAQITGLSQGYLSMLESGARRLTNIDKIDNLLEGLGAPAHLARATTSTYAVRGLRSDRAEEVEGASAAPNWERPLDVAERLNAATASNTSTAALQLLQQLLDGIVRDYEAQGPYKMASAATDARRSIQGLLMGRQPPRQRAELFRLAAQAAGLLAYMSVNAGRPVLADTYCTEAAALAEEIDDRALLMWVFGTRSLSSYYSGRYEEAVRWADTGIDLDPTHPQAIRLLINGRARALGKLSDVNAAGAAIAAAEELTSRSEVPDGLTACISFAPYSHARTLANAITAHVSLGQTDQVLTCADDIDYLIDHVDSAWTRTLVGLDVATALLQGPRPDVEHAMSMGRRALANAAGPPIRSVVQRAGELRDQATRWKEQATVREYGSLFQAWQTAAPETRELAEVCKDGAHR
ncbi:helix-turn-helix domain-containing protein [Streptomyces monticola]|uniref:Helix-turn-helix domain-containing protein n=1 Tax=Streptomyces monticola TaxID=2666263 RepID=A0ABW2JLR7_9ACTN